MTPTTTTNAGFIDLEPGLFLPLADEDVIEREHWYDSLDSEDQDFIDAMPEYTFRPIEFAQHILGVQLDVFQGDVLLALTEYKKVSVASATGVGKTFLAAIADIQFQMTRPDALVPCTAPSQAHLSTVLWPELHALIDNSVGGMVKRFLKWEATYIRHVSNPHRAFAVQKTATAHSSVDSRTGTTGQKQNVGAAGLHRDHMLIIADEASGIDTPNLETFIATCTGYENRLLFLGNPVYTHGMFFDIWFNQKMARNWRKFRVASLRHKEVARSDTGKRYVATKAVNTAQSQEWLDTYGPRSILVQAKVFGNHPITQADDVEFNYAEISAAMERVVCDACGRWDDEFDMDVVDHSCREHKDDPVQIGCDAARFGDDECTYYVRKGNRIVQVIIQAKSPADLIITTLKRLSHKWPDPTRPEYDDRPLICVDEAGAGGGGAIVDVMAADGYENVVGVEFGRGARDPNQWANRASEMWMGELREFLDRLQLPHGDTKLLNQLITRPYDFAKGGRKGRKTKEVRRILPKPVMKRRGLDSPDRADGLCLCITDPPMAGVF
jgi:phage terminase large subunit